MAVKKQLFTLYLMLTKTKGENGQVMLSFISELLGNKHFSKSAEEWKNLILN